jgi:membrane protease YdiL (CAAX protease family)
VPPAAPTSPVAGQPIEEGRPGWPLAAWVLIDGALGLVLAVLLQFLALFVFIQIRGETIMGGLEALQNDPTFTLVAAPTLGLGFAALAALRIRLLRGLPWEWFGLHARRLLPAIGWGALAGVAFLIVNASLSLLFQLAGSIPDQSEQIVGPFRNATPVQLALLGVFIVLIGPFLEELFFRGYALRAFRQRLGPTWGVILSAALFAAPHAFGITTGFIGLLVPIFCGGVILALVYQRTGNLWSAVVAHCMNNLVGFIGLLVALQIK